MWNKFYKWMEYPRYNGERARQHHFCHMSYYETMLRKFVLSKQQQIDCISRIKAHKKAIEKIERQQKSLGYR